MFKSFKVDNARRVEFEDKFIQIPKSKWAYLRNNIDTFHSTGGEGTPSEQIPIVNVSEWNKTACGKNLHDYLKNAGINDGSFERITNGYRVTGNITTTGEFGSSSGWFQSQSTNGFASGITLLYLPIGEYTISADIKLIENRNTKKIRIYLRGLNDTGSIFNGSIYNLIVEQTVRISQTFNVEAANYYTPLFAINSNIVEITNVSTNKGTDTNYTPYTGNTYPYRLEDVNGVLHEAGDLPDGTADSVNWETGELIKRTKSIVLDGSESGWSLYSSDALDDYIRFINYTVITDDEKKVGNDKGLNGNALCSHFKNGRAWDASTLDNLVCFSDTVSAIWFKIAKTELTGYSVGLENWQKIDLFKTWLGLNNVTVQYKLETPVTYKIKEYGKTYGGQVWEYNEKPIQVEDSVCNVFSDKNVKMKFKAVSY